MMCITVSQPVERELSRSETATFAKEVHRKTGQPELRLRRAEQGQHRNQTIECGNEERQMKDLPLELPASSGICSESHHGIQLIEQCGLKQCFD